jgi:hypothetical protein
MTIQIQVGLKELDNNNGSGGLEIAILEAEGDPTGDSKNPIPVFIEYYKGQLRLVVWNGNQDPEVPEIKLRN